jgi:CMP-2-keto-3-deoxyoctulosonic acid synthetase
VAGYFLTACRYVTTEYDRMRADDRGTNMYAPFRAAESSGTDAVRVAVDEASVLAHVKVQWLVFASSTQAADGTRRVGDVLATDAETLASTAPHVFDYVAKKRLPLLS